MRWDELRLTEDAGGSPAGTVPLLPGVRSPGTSDTPEFAGMTFHEVTCRSALNKVPDASAACRSAGRSTPAGLLHAWVLLRPETHEYLDLDSGADFDSQVVVKTNVGEVLRRELASAVLGRRARGDGHQRRLLPAGRGPLPADA